jgi:hypothetical protein
MGADGDQEECKNKFGVSGVVDREEDVLLHMRVSELMNLVARLNQIMVRTAILGSWIALGHE